jgi:hypothetical protein
MCREVEHAAGVEVNQDAVTHADLKESAIRLRMPGQTILVPRDDRVDLPGSAAASRASNPLRSTFLKADLCWSTNSSTTCQPRSSAYFLKLANWSGMLRPSSDSRA